MFREAPTRPQLSAKNVLIVGGNGILQDLRARLLRDQGIQVHAVNGVEEAELAWVPSFFDLVLLDVRRRSKEALTFYSRLRRRHPNQRIFFLVGPPQYISASYAEPHISTLDEVKQDYSRIKQAV
jgi:CheY-like chemotaxis protein